jgi:hypothetical protein
MLAGPQVHHILGGHDLKRKQVQAVVHVALQMRVFAQGEQGKAQVSACADGVRHAAASIQVSACNVRQSCIMLYTTVPRSPPPMHGSP